jgi:hypothetical protein
MYLPPRPQGRAAPNCGRRSAAGAGTAAAEVTLKGAVRQLTTRQPGEGRQPTTGSRLTARHSLAGRLARIVSALPRFQLVCGVADDASHPEAKWPLAPWRHLLQRRVANVEVDRSLLGGDGPGLAVRALRRRARPGGLSSWRRASWCRRARENPGLVVANRITFLRRTGRDASGSLRTEGYAGQRRRWA